MPIDLESGRLQLTDAEIRLYASAAALLAKIHSEPFSLSQPMRRNDFAMLVLAHGVVTGDEELLDQIAAVAEDELARRKTPH